MVRVLVPHRRYQRTLEGIEGAELISWNINDPSEPPDAEVLITVHPVEEHHCRRIGEIPSLTHLLVMSLGFEWITPHLPDRPIVVANAKGAVEAPTAEMAMGLIIGGVRHFAEFAAARSEQRWDTHTTGSIATSTVMIIGQGGLGRAIEERLLPFEPAELILVARSTRTRDDGRTVHGVAELDELLPRADVVLLAIPLTGETIGLLDRRRLALLPDGALVVNIGRGLLLDTDALVGELRTGRLRAALDVTDPEPLPEGHPLWSAPGCLLTPHVGGDTTTYLDKTVALAGEQVGRIVAGRPLLNVVDP